MTVLYCRYGSMGIPRTSDPEQPRLNSGCALVAFGQKPKVPFKDLQRPFLGQKDSPKSIGSPPKALKVKPKVAF